MRWFALALAACSSTPLAPVQPTTTKAPPPPSSDPPPTTQSPTPPPLPPADVLSIGNKIDRAIKSDQAHRFRISLEPGQVALGVVMQDGLDLMVTTFDPAGKKLGEFDSPNGNKGPEPFIVMASVGGSYDIEVKPFVEPAPPGTPAQTPSEGRYQASLDEVLTGDQYVERGARERIASPRIFELWRAVHRKQANAVATFWNDLKGKAPIVEPYPDDPKSALVTFVFRATTPYVGLFGATDFREKPLVRIPDTDVWYLTARLPADSRVDYAFVPVAGPPENASPFRKQRGPDPRWAAKQHDPNNPRTHFDFSRLELPGAAPQPWIEPKAETPKGKTAPLTIPSGELKEARKIVIYTPPNYDPRQRYPLVIAFDGEVYGGESNALIPLPTILDNLIAAKKIPPVVAALVANQGTRERDLPGSATFSRFVAKELVPKLRADYRAGMTPDQTLVTGSSFGGLCSMYTGFAHSDVIGLVLSNSGSFQYVQNSLATDLAEWTEGGWLIRDIAAAAKKPLKVYLDAGRFEMGLRDSNRQLRDVLTAKGYPVTYAEFSGGHDYGMWRHTIADGLIALLGKR